MGSITGVLNTQVDLRNALNGKQATLVSGTNIKTIDGKDILGNGDLDIAGEYYKKTEVDNLISAIPETDLTNYYNKTEVDSLIDAIPPTDLSGYYDKTETETLISNKVDKEVGKGLSTNDFTDAFKQALESNKVQNITPNSVTKKLVVTYTDGTFVDLNVDNTSDEDKPMSSAQSAAMMAKFNLRDVVQETGSNSSKVMSQKASTEVFYRAGSSEQKAGKIYVQSTEPTENVEEGDIWLKI